MIKRRPYAKLPQGAYTYDLKEVLGKYKKGEKMTDLVKKIIVEEYPGKAYVFEMNEGLYHVIVDLFDKQYRLKQSPTFLNIYDQLPDEMKKSIELITMKRAPKQSIEVRGMSFKNTVNE